LVLRFGFCFLVWEEVVLIDEGESETKVSFFSLFSHFFFRRQGGELSLLLLPGVNGVERARGRDGGGRGADADDGATAALLHAREDDAGHLKEG
jgi:hypothetical protein